MESTDTEVPPPPSLTRGVCASEENVFPHLPRPEPLRKMKHGTLQGPAETLGSGERP